MRRRRGECYDNDTVRKTMTEWRVLDLFSGIGAYALGVERAGMHVVAFCENAEYPRNILRQHWPKVPIYDDVRTLTGDTLARDGIAVDVIIGGWPCQDISPAGAGLGLDGARSGLWIEIARLAGELRPALLILENSSALLGINGGRDFSQVLGDLAALGYDAEWHCLSAAGFDAPHIRDRLWIVAHRRGAFADIARGCEPEQSAPARRGRQSDRAHIDGGVRAEGFASDVDDQRELQSQGREPEIRRWICDCVETARAAERGCTTSNPHGFPSFGAAIARRERHTWEPESEVVRVVPGNAAGLDGIDGWIEEPIPRLSPPGTANRVHRIHALGNCNPPIIIEAIARAVMDAAQ